MREKWVACSVDCCNACIFIRRRVGRGSGAWTDAGALIRLSSAPYSLPENLIKLRWKKVAKSNKGEPIAEHINLLQLGQVDVQPLRDRIKSLQGPGEPPLLWTEEVETGEERKKGIEHGYWCMILVLCCSSIGQKGGGGRREHRSSHTA